RHIGQPGTTWDLYTVRGNEAYSYGAAGSIGSRLAYHDPTNTQIDGMRSRQGPSLPMLRQNYNTILLLTGNLNYEILGPQSRKSQDDIGILERWLSSGNTSAPNRGLWVMGQSIVEDNNAGPPQDAFNTDYLGVSLRNESYPLFASNPSAAVDLTP